MYLPCSTWDDQSESSVSCDNAPLLELSSDEGLIISSPEGFSSWPYFCTIIAMTTLMWLYSIYGGNSSLIFVNLLISVRLIVKVYGV